jgi:hypothetical protein
VSEYELHKKQAQDPNTPIEMLTELSKSDYPYVRCLVSQNMSTPVEILIGLSKDERWLVRSYVALNTNTPIQTLIELSEDNEEVRFDVASNPNLPFEIVRDNPSRFELRWFECNSNEELVAKVKEFYETYEDLL